jgi:hypothetical protein
MTAVAGEVTAQEKLYIILMWPYNCSLLILRDKWTCDNRSGNSCGWHAAARSSARARHYVRVEDSTAVTMENVVFWDIKTQFVPHRRHITSPLQNPAG